MPYNLAQLLDKVVPCLAESRALAPNHFHSDELKRRKPDHHPKQDAYVALFYPFTKDPFAPFGTSITKFIIAHIKVCFNVESATIAESKLRDIDCERTKIYLCSHLALLSWVLSWAMGNLRPNSTIQG